MYKCNKWLNTSGSIIYYYIFSNIVDKKGSAIGIIIHMRDSEITNYRIQGNLAKTYICGEYSSNNTVVTDKKELKFLNKLPIYHDTVKFIFEDKDYM